MLVDAAQATVVIDALVRMSKDKHGDSHNGRRSGGVVGGVEGGVEGGASASSSSIVEEAVVAIGLVCHQYPSTRARACEEMIKIATHDRSSEEVHFACGETLAKLCLHTTTNTTGTTNTTDTTTGTTGTTTGTTGTTTDTTTGTTTTTTTDTPSPTLMASLLSQTFALLKDARPKVRGAASVLLLSMVCRFFCFFCFFVCFALFIDPLTDKVQPLSR